MRGASEKLRAEVDRIDPEKGEFLLRLGHGSQADFVTVNPPFRSLGKDKQGELNSRTLFDYQDGLWPLGYCRVKLLDSEA